MSSAPCSRVSARRCSRKPGSGGTTPILPATGSTMSAAIWSGCASNAGRAIAGAAGGGILDGADDARVRVARDQWAPRAEIVDIAVVVGVPHVGALTSGNEPGGAANRLEGPNGRIDATG